MNNARTRLAVRYQKALRAHLDLDSGKPSVTARDLGASALRQSMSVLDLAILHERAMVLLAPSFHFETAGNRPLKQACGFFALALGPMEKNLAHTRKTNLRLHARNRLLRTHAAALASSNQRLVREVALRKTAETSVRQNQDQLRRLTRKIISAQEDERKQISRELHDEVVQTLVGINVELAALGRGASLDLRALKAKITRTRRLVEHSVSEVHRFARDLRPAALDDLGLVPALRAFGNSLALRKKFKFAILAFPGVETLAGSKRTVLFRVAQEALANAARHASASAVTISLSRLASGVRMEIADDGKSFPVHTVLAAANPKRLGLVGMRERVAMVGGTLLITSVPGQGTVVRADLPLRPEKTRP